MKRLIGWILLVCVLFAQSAWAWEGHAGHFEQAGGHQEHPAHGSHSPADPNAPADYHCAHSPVHFLAIHRDLPQVPVSCGRAQLPAYRGMTPSHCVAPPTQPPRA
jgi:hypothetical protein